MSIVVFDSKAHWMTIAENDIEQQWDERLTEQTPDEKIPAMRGMRDCMTLMQYGWHEHERGQYVFREAALPVHSRLVQKEQFLFVLA